MASVPVPVSILGYASPKETNPQRLARRRAQATKEALLQALRKISDHNTAKNITRTVTAAGQGTATPPDLPPEYQRAVVVRMR